jgi:hypothetical protein
MAIALANLQYVHQNLSIHEAYHHRELTVKGVI